MLGKTDEAREGYDKLLQREERIKNFGELYWAILSDRGLIYIKDKKPAEAINFFKKAVAVIETQRSTINTEASKIGFVGDKQEVYKNLIAALFQEGKFAEALDYAERGKARALVDMLATKKNFYGASRDNKEVATLLRELEEAEQKSLALAYTSEKKNSLRAYVVNKRQEVIQAAPELFSLIAVSSLGSKDIQAMLPQDETLIEYYYHGDDLFAFAVTKDTVKGVKIDGKGLDKEVETFRKHIINSLKSNRTARQARGLTVVHSSTVANLNSTTDALYRRVFAPVEGLIKTKNVILVPHGSLHYLPFNALKSDKDYLINRYSLSVLPSASVMKFLQVQKKGQAGELIVFGNPDLGNAKYDLPFAQSEAMAITKDNPNAKVLLRKQASKTAVKKFAVQFKYVHFACHGTFNPAKPLESGLMLAKDESDDGMLTVSEMYNMRLNADLVTLSACETALGKVANGDDVVGFTRGFLFAGTNSIVSSLWQVDDKATSMIMEEFYRNLKTMDKRTALRLAQLKIINTYNEHPFFWAAFQLTGNVK